MITRFYKFEQCQSGGSWILHDGYVDKVVYLAVLDWNDKSVGDASLDQHNVREAQELFEQYLEWAGTLLYKSEFHFFGACECCGPRWSSDYGLPDAEFVGYDFLAIPEGALVVELDFSRRKRYGSLGLPC